jgi:hypothetical protein
MAFLGVDISADPMDVPVDTCEVCGWTPTHMSDYQYFTVWPMWLVGEPTIRDVVLCRCCYNNACESVASVHNPEDEESDEDMVLDSRDNDLAFSLHDMFHIEDVNELIIPHYPEVPQHLLVFAQLLHSITTNPCNAI